MAGWTAVSGAPARWWEERPAGSGSGRAGLAGRVGSGSPPRPGRQGPGANGTRVRIGRIAATPLSGAATTITLAGHSADADRPRPCSRLVSFERRGSTRLSVRRSLLPSRTLWEDTHGASSHVRSRLLGSASDPDLLGVCLAAASGEVCRAAGDFGVGVATLEGLPTDGYCRALPIVRGPEVLLDLAIGLSGRRAGAGTSTFVTCTPCARRAWSPREAPADL